MVQPSRKSSERWLFFTLWIFLLVGWGLWRFYPSSMIPVEASPTIILGTELKFWFNEAKISETLPSHYTVALKLDPEYRRRLNESQMGVQLGFDLWGEQSMLYQGRASCTISTENPSISIELANPERIHARKIELHLAH